MKRLLTIWAIVFYSIAFAQAPELDYTSYQKYTSAKKLALSLDFSSHAHIIFDTDLNQLQINYGLGWTNISSEFDPSGSLEISGFWDFKFGDNIVINSDGDQVVRFQGGFTTWDNSITNEATEIGANFHNITTNNTTLGLLKNPNQSTSGTLFYPNLTANDTIATKTDLESVSSGGNNVTAVSQLTNDLDFQTLDQVNAQVLPLIAKDQTNSTVLELDRLTVYNYRNAPSLATTYTVNTNTAVKGSYNRTLIDNGLSTYPTITGATALPSPTFNSNYRYYMHTSYDGTDYEYFFTIQNLTPENPLNDGLIASWSLIADGTDSTDNNYALTLNGAPVFSTVGNRACITFDGTDDQALGTTEIINAIDGANEFTLSFWIRKPTGSPFDNGIITTKIANYGVSPDDAEPALQLRHDGISGTTGRFAYQIEGAPVYTTPTNSYFDVWQHVVWTYQRNTGVFMYVNGSLVTSTPGATENLDKALSADVFSVGRGNKNPFDGYGEFNMADLRFFDTYKSASDATAIYNDSNN